MDFDRFAAGLSRSRRGPLYRQLADQLHVAIRNGELAMGSRIPSERDLARLLGISRTTVLNAYGLLREHGLLDSARGSGTRVAAAAGLGPTLPASSLHASKLLEESAAGVIDMSTSVIAGACELPHLQLGETELAELAGTGYVPLGLPTLRTRIAGQYTRHGLATTADEVIVTSGAQQAISLLCALFGRSGATIVTEKPTYSGALDAIRAVGATVLPVRTDREGMSVRALAEVLEHHSVSLIYVMSTCQNPTGSIMGAIRRTELGNLAQRAGVPIVDDTAMAQLAPDKWRFPAEGGLTNIVIGSLSKLFWPGLRVGWLRAPTELVARVARLKVTADLGSSHVSQLLATRLLGSVDSTAELRRRQLGERRDLLDRLLQTRLPDWTSNAPADGMFLWVRLPNADAESFAQLALHHGVRVLPGTRTTPDNTCAEHVRVSCVAEPADLLLGVDRLAQAWGAFTSISTADRLSLDLAI